MAVSAAPRRALNPGVSVDSSTGRLSHLAAHVLSLDHSGQFSTENGVWGRLFLQQSNQVECVTAAAAAFGAAYEAWFLNHDTDHFAVLRHYGTALSQLRAAFASKTTSLECVALASMILACAEIMTQQNENALSHFHGAVHIVQDLEAQANGKVPSAEVLTLKDELVQVDIQIGSYGLSQTPQIAHFDGYGAEEASDAFREPRLASEAALRCLYRTRQYIEVTSKVRYTYPGWKDRDSAMCEAQAAMAAQCQTVMDGLAALAEQLQSTSASASGNSPARDDEALADLYGLRTQVATTLVFILCIHDPFETSYDDHLALFQSIIKDAAASSRLRRRANAKAHALKRFSTRPGVISPLFFTTMKCRDPSVRSLAIAMLKEQGREGPSDGQIMAAIGAQIAALESPESMSASGEPKAERLRVHGHGVFPGGTTGVSHRVLEVEFSRPSPPLEQGWGRVDYTNLDNWVIWREPVQI